MMNNCAEFEERVMAYLDGEQSAAEKGEVELHLAHCGDCRRFADVMRHLDHAIADQLRPPTLPDDFDALLWRRIETEIVVVPESERAARKQAIEAEYQAELKRLRRRYVSVPALLDALSMVSVFSIGLLFFCHWTPHVLELLAVLRDFTSTQLLLFPAVACLVLYFSALAFVFRSRLTRLLADCV